MIKRFTLETKDARGEQHTIEVEQHGGEEGWLLFLEIVSIAGEPFGELVEAASGVLAQLRGEEATTGLELESAKIDGALLGRGFAKLGSALLTTRGGEPIFKRLFAHTIRDGKKFSPAVAAGKDRWTINSEFQGNYLEMIAIAAFVMAANYSNLLGGSSLDVSAIVAATRSI